MWIVERIMKERSEMGEMGRPKPSAEELALGGVREKGRQPEKDRYEG